MKICLFACVWGRHKILEVFAMGVRRLQESFNIDPITVVSTPEDMELCNDLKLNPVIHPNSPLGRKHNEGINDAFKKDWNRILIMGSDDLISTEGLEILLNADRSHVGFRKMYAVNTECDQALYFEYEKNTRLIGAGRMLTREAAMTSSYRCTFLPRNSRKITPTEYPFSTAAATHLERRGLGRKKGGIFGLWEDGLERNLDNSSDINLSLCGFPPYCVEDEKTHIIDLKNELVQINYYSDLTMQEPHKQHEVKGWDWFLSTQEKKAIKQLQNKTA